MRIFVMDKIQALLDDIIKSLVFLSILFQEIKLVLICVMLLIVFNQITGVWKALKFHKWSWHKFKDLWAKIILYSFAIMAMYGLEEMIMGTHDHYATKAVGLVIGFAEMSSGYINISIITGKDILRDFIKAYKK